MVGISLRYAQAAGLHLRNEDTSVPATTKRTSAQIWWALHSIECILTSITGRPRVIERKDCTVPPPRVLADKQFDVTSKPSAITSVNNQSATIENSSAQDKAVEMPGPLPRTQTLDSFLDAWTQLDVLQHKTLSVLYAAKTAVHSWKHMQDEIASLTTELDEWALHALPQGPFDRASTQEPNTTREHLLLYFYYQSRVRLGREGFRSTYELLRRCQKACCANLGRHQDPGFSG